MTLAVVACMSSIPALSATFESPAKTASDVALAPENAEVFTRLGGEGLDDPASGRVPNYLRALAANNPATAPTFAHLFKTMIYGGTVDTEVKAAMGLKIAEENGSAYLSAHLSRILQATERGKSLQSLVTGSTKGEVKERIALRYASDLTRAVHGVSDADFARARGVYNDAQLVELTSVTCFFNYFARFCQGAGLPLESWVKEAPNALPKQRAESELARITLASDAELQMAAGLATPSPDLKKGLGIGVANSQRAMVRVPDIAAAWWDYWKSVREQAALSRELQLDISFAVSMANGCRYCTLHQVAGLRRLNVEPAKLLAMQKDDSILNAKELACVTFARKLTKTPAGVTSGDYAALRAGVGSDREAMDALMQTCAFNFMNRFTDGLRLPSEDEAIRVYQEVYGAGSYANYHKQVSANNPH